MAVKEDIESMFQAVDKLRKRLDILINNVALGYHRIMDSKHEDWQYIIDTNLMGYLACTHHAART